MEDIMKTNEIEEVDEIDPVEEEYDLDGRLVIPMLLVFAGGIATPFVVKGARKLYAIAKSKWITRKLSGEDDTDTAEIVDIQDAERTQTESGKNTADK